MKIKCLLTVVYDFVIVTLLFIMCKLIYSFNYSWIGAVFYFDLFCFWFYFESGIENIIKLSTRDITLITLLISVSN